LIPMSVKAIVGATLIDGSGKKPLSDSAIIVRGEMIEVVGKQGEVKIPDGAEVIEASGKWLTPGLIDLHVHLYSDKQLLNPTVQIGQRDRSILPVHGHKPHNSHGQLCCSVFGFFRSVRLGFDGYWHGCYC